MAVDADNTPRETTEPAGGEGPETARYLARLDDLALRALSGRMKELMAKRSLSSRALSRAAHVPIGSVLEAVNGRRKPSLGKLVAYAHALDVSLDQLLGTTAANQLVVEARSRHALNASE